VLKRVKVPSAELAVCGSDGSVTASSRGGVESNRSNKLRDECLDWELFGSLREARVILEQYRKEYNEERPHSALGYRTPEAYVRESRNKSDGGCAPPNPAPLAAAGVQGEQGATAPVRPNQNRKNL
jgi:hypothetical protein